MNRRIYIGWAATCAILIFASFFATRVGTGETFFRILAATATGLLVLALLFRHQLDNALNSATRIVDRAVDGAHAMNIEQRYRAERSIGFLLLILTVIAGLYVVVLSSTNPSSYYSLIQEDGLVEYASAVFWLIAAIQLAYYVSFATVHAPEFGYFKIPYVLVLAFCVIAGGEEISWGQRILEIETPALLKSINVQQELNLHNIGSISVFSNAFFLLTLIFFLAIPYLIKSKPSIRALFDYFALPAPHRFATWTFLIGLAVWLFVGIRFGTLGFHPFSFYEESYYTQMDDEIFEFFAAFSFLSFSTMNMLKSVHFRRR